MTLDLQDLVADWDYRAGEICARTVVGRDGSELLQLRVDLGIMQMFLDGRPDGARHHGLPTVLDYIRHEMRLGRNELLAEDWRELEREMYQINYRRLALSSLVEDCLGRNEIEAARIHLQRALRDIEACLDHIRVTVENPTCQLSVNCQALRPTLVFHRGRLCVQLAIVEEHYEEAVEAADESRRELKELLAEIGLDDEQQEDDPGVVFLYELGQRLRQEYGISMTTRERLEKAIDSDDFEAAARLRDELQRRNEDCPPQ